MAGDSKTVKKFNKRKHEKGNSQNPSSKKAKLGGLNSSDGIKKSKDRKEKVFKKRHEGGLNKRISGPNGKPKDGKENTIKSKREHRLHAKEIAELRKKKRKRHYTLERELASLWEKMRQHNIAKEERSKLVSEAVMKMKGKISEIAASHVSSRVLQTCVKYCSQVEKDMVFEELQPHFLTLASNTYAVHLVKKMLDNASKKQLAGFISSLHGHVASLLRHMVGSVVVEHAYQLGNAAQKQELLMELYSTELQLFKDLVSMKERRLVDVISKLRLQKGSVVRHMSSVIQPILEKGIVDHSIIHKMLIEFFSLADKTSVADVIQQLSGPLLVRMIHTRDGSQTGILCIKHGSAKERKKIIKGMKGHIGKIAHDQCGTMVLVSIFSVVDDTKLVTKIVIKELQAILKELVLDKNGRRPILQLLHPNCSRYFSPDDLASLNSTIPSLCTKDETEANAETKSLDAEKPGEDTMATVEETIRENDEDEVPDAVQHSMEGGKKDPLVRRQELLVNSGLAEKLIDVCIENVAELITSNFGKEVIYEVATGGADGILMPTQSQKLTSLHEAIASLVSKYKSEESEEEHVLENFHSSRTIRKLVLDCPAFAVTIWEKSLQGKARIWAQGHGSKVVCAFLESPDPKVLQLAKGELQPLVDEGILKLPEKKQSKNEDQIS